MGEGRREEVQEHKLNASNTNKSNAQTAIKTKSCYVVSLKETKNKAKVL